jgi:RNA recognition motif-containing protein
MGKRLYISNISNRATEEKLGEIFAETGRVESINLIMDARTKKPKGMAFLVMSSEEEAHKAIDTINGTLFLGRPLNVSLANTQEPRERRDLDVIESRKKKK